MKTKIVDKILILLGFNIYGTINIFFGVSLIISVISFTFFSELPLIIGYLFWFSFGLFLCSLIMKGANNYLKKKYEEKNSYYLKLLDNYKNKMDRKL